MNTDDPHPAPDRTGRTWGGSALSAVPGLLALAGLVYGAESATDPGLDGRHPAALLLTVGTGLAWAGWMAGRGDRHPRLVLVSLTLLAAIGGAMTAISTFGAVLLGVAGLCTATVIAPLPTLALVSGGVATAAVAAAVVDGPEAYGLPAAAAGALIGLLLGNGRRQQMARTKADAELTLARERSAIDHERAELLAERNRIAREVHDVLAHTLSALAMQMTALDSLVEDGAEVDEVRASIGRSRRLVVEGLDETRRAVRALRDEPIALDEQLAALAAGEGGSFRLSGLVRPLPPAAGTALLRVAQESLTNARKHAPGTPVTVELAYGDTYTGLTVTNTTTAASALPPTGDLAPTGGGYGLQGMRERVELLGGTLDAGPQNGCWRVTAEVPV